MLKKVREKLKEIEERENIKILHCVESGSRAWGFASPDSDYDVRFIYVRSKEYYLRLDKTRDVIEWQLDETLDISGWDLQKALKLLHKSNPTLFEWNSSPIVYKTTEDWAEISSVIEEYFIIKMGLYHYLSTAKSNCNKYLRGDSVIYKKYFYMLRPLLACKWIIAKGTPPPVLFSTLVDECLGENLLPDVVELIKMKTANPEICEGKRLGKLDEYIEKTIDEVEQVIAELPDKDAPGWEALNEIFLKLI